MRDAGVLGLGMGSLLLVCLVPASLFAQGSLTPPGAPAPTMKTLTQVEPRTAITNAPYTITQPGSYYLTANLSSTGHGIFIQASRVTLDLMGFSLTGYRGAPDCGIWLDGETNRVLRDVVVKGGMVNDFGTGMKCEYAQNSRMEGLTFSSNATYGITLLGASGQCNGNTISHCVISGTTFYGVHLNAGSGQCNGNTISDCTIEGNRSFGIYFQADSGQCNMNVIANCDVRGNVGTGIYLSALTSGQCNGNRIAGGVISGNAGDGIQLNGYTGQCDGNIIVACVARANASYGVYLNGESGHCNGNMVTDCSVSSNASYGVYLNGYLGDCDGNRIGMGLGSTVAAKADLSGKPGVDVIWGSFDLGKLMPGDTVLGVFKLRVSKQFTQPEAIVDLAVSDYIPARILTARSLLNREIELRISPPSPGSNTASGSLTVTSAQSAIPLLEGPFLSSRTIATASAGAAFNVTRTRGDYYQIALPKERHAWVSKSNTIPGGSPDAKYKDTLIEPPVISVEGNRVFKVEGKSAVIKGSASHPEKVRDLMVYVGDQKIMYEPNRDPKSPNKMLFNVEVPIKEGSNYVIIVARYDDKTISTFPVFIRREQESH